MTKKIKKQDSDLHIRISTSDYTELRNVADKRGISVSDFIRTSIKSASAEDKADEKKSDETKAQLLKKKSLTGQVSAPPGVTSVFSPDVRIIPEGSSFEQVSSEKRVIQPGDALRLFRELDT